MSPFAELFSAMNRGKLDFNRAITSADFFMKKFVASEYCDLPKLQLVFTYVSASLKQPNIWTSYEIDILRAIAASPHLSSELFEVIASEFLKNENRDLKIYKELIANPMIDSDKKKTTFKDFIKSQQGNSALALSNLLGYLRGAQRSPLELDAKFNQFFHRFSQEISYPRPELAPITNASFVFMTIFRHENIALKTLRKACQVGLKNPETFVKVFLDSFIKTPQGILVFFENLTNMGAVSPSSVRGLIVKKLMIKLAEMTEQDFHFIQEEGDYQIIQDKRTLTTRLLNSLKEESNPGVCLNILENLIYSLPFGQLLNEEGINILIQLISNFESTKTKSDFTQSLVKKIKINELQAKQLWIHSPTSISTQEFIDFHFSFAQNPGISPQTSLWFLKRIKKLRNGALVRFEELPIQVSEDEVNR